MIEAFVVVTVLGAALLQSLSGFGFALVVMPLFTLVLGVQTAAPIVAMAGLTLNTMNVIRYHRAVDLGEVSRLAAASIVGVLVGIWILTRVDELIVERLMGVILIGYVAYTILQPATGRPLSQSWVYPAGFLAGCLGGAYNTSGPPVVIYGSMRQWPKEEFRAMLQSIFLINGLVVVASHLFAHHITARTWGLYLYAMPALALGVLAGSVVDSRVDHKRFRALVVVMVFLLGLSLLVGARR